jgi:hypothetical protein
MTTPSTSAASVGSAKHTLSPRTDADKFEHFISGSHCIYVVKEEVAREMEIELGVIKERKQELLNEHAALLEQAAAGQELAEHLKVCIWALRHVAAPEGSLAIIRANEAEAALAKYSAAKKQP